MPAYQATFRHPAAPERRTARRVVAGTLLKATLVAVGMEVSVAIAEGWTEKAADLIGLILLPEDAPDCNALPTESWKTCRRYAAIARARARAAEFAVDAAHADRIFRAACVIAGVRSVGSAQDRV